MISPYKILGIGTDEPISIQLIKKAYREKCKVHHPDKGGKAFDFHQLKEAYDMLLDEFGRAQQVEQIASEVFGDLI